MNEPNSRVGLIESARDGNADAFAQLVDPMRQSLRRYANSKIADGRLKIRFDIDDILQETLLLAWEDIAAVHSQSEESFRCWLMVVHRNVVYKQMRHALAEQRDPGREQPLEPGTIVSGTRAPKLQDKGTSPSTPARRHEQRDRLTEALETLSEKQRHVVRLRYLEELSCREIEKETGMSPGAIQRQLRNGLANLRKNCNTDLVGLITKLTTDFPG